MVFRALAARRAGLPIRVHTEGLSDSAGWVVYVCPLHAPPACRVQTRVVTASSQLLELQRVGFLSVRLYCQVPYTEVDHWNVSEGFLDCCSPFFATGSSALTTSSVLRLATRVCALPRRYVCPFSPAAKGEFAGCGSDCVDHATCAAPLAQHFTASGPQTAQRRHID